MKENNQARGDSLTPEVEVEIQRMVQQSVNQRIASHINTTLRAAGTVHEDVGMRESLANTILRFLLDKDEFLATQLRKPEGITWWMVIPMVIPGYSNGYSNGYSRSTTREFLSGVYRWREAQRSCTIHKRR